MSTRKCTSPIWEYFDAPVKAKEKRKDIKKVRCKLGGVHLAHEGGTTNNFAFVGEAPGGVQVYFRRPKLFDEASDVDNNGPQVFPRARRHNYQADSGVRGKGPSSAERSVAIRALR